MITYEEKIGVITAILHSLTIDEQVSMHNEACDILGYSDDCFYSMCEFDDIFCNMKPWDIARMCYYGDFYPNDGYFKFNGYGNPISASYPDNWIDFVQIAECCVDNDEDFGNNEIRELLD